MDQLTLASASSQASQSSNSHQDDHQRYHPLSNVNNFNISILNFVDIALPMWPKFPRVINMAVHIQIEFNQETEKATQCPEPTLPQYFPRAIASSKLWECNSINF